MKVGVFGGSFDPVHLGHLVAAEYAAFRLGLEQVRFVPAGRHPFKGEHRASGPDRLAMVAAAIADNPRFVLDAREVQRPGPSYTVDTLRELAAESPGDRLFLLIGADAAADLASWREVELIAQLATVVVLTRPGAVVSAQPVRHQVVAVPGIDVSASEIREAVRRGEPIRYLVPKAVEDYIVAHGLYRD